MNRNEKWFLYITGGLLGAAVFTAVTWFLARASRMPWRSAILLGKLEDCTRIPPAHSGNAG